MSDPQRLSEEQTGLAATLLRAGADEGPSPRVIERTLAAVGVSAATLGAAAVATASAAAPGAVGGLATTGVVKLLAVGAMAGVGVGGVAFGVRTALQSEPVPVERAHSAPVRSAEERAPLPSEPVASIAPPPATEDAPSPPPPRQAPPSASFPPVAERAPLAPEVALVDRAHAALRRGDAPAALAELASYEQDFSEPRLLPEVLALRMEASDRLGDATAARFWAGRLLGRFPRSAQAARARALLER
jgi:hypothetical protein